MATDFFGKRLGLVLTTWRRGSEEMDLNKLLEKKAKVKTDGEDTPGQVGSAENGNKWKEYTDGRVYVGQLCPISGLPHGAGEMRRKGGIIEYDGEFRKGRRHGIGTLFLEDGSTWTGRFENDLQHGYGILKPDEMVLKKRMATLQQLKAKKKRTFSEHEEQELLECRKGLDGYGMVFFHGRLVCHTTELLDSCVTLRVGKIWRTGVVTHLRTKNGNEKMPMTRIRFQDAGDLEGDKWWDLSLYEFKLLRAAGQYLHVESNCGSRQIIDK